MHTITSILVPVDFTETCYSAVSYVIGMSKKMNIRVTLLHIIESGDEKFGAQEKMKKLVSKFDFGTTEIEYRIEEGNFLEDIGRIAELTKHSLIVMGTHGERGLQKVFGSYALKVVKHSTVALIILQKETVYRDIKKIAMTIDLERESVQILKHAAAMANYYDAEIHLIGGKHTDPYLKTNVAVNMRVCRDSLGKKGIKHEIQLLERKNFDENLIAYCSENGIDMLAASHYDNALFYFLSDKFVQHLIENELNIPLITIEAMETRSYYF
jgi:nucleotide-binding universal stress UspA family protein